MVIGSFEIITGNINALYILHLILNHPCFQNTHLSTGTQHLNGKQTYEQHMFEGRFITEYIIDI